MIARRRAFPTPRRELKCQRPCRPLPRVRGVALRLRVGSTIVGSCFRTSVSIISRSRQCGTRREFVSLADCWAFVRHMAIYGYSLYCRRSGGRCVQWRDSKPDATIGQDVARHEKPAATAIKIPSRHSVLVWPIGGRCPSIEKHPLGHLVPESPTIQCCSSAPHSRQLPDFDSQSSHS